VDIEGRICNIYVQKRPGAEHFLETMSKHYEVVIFTASLSKYAEPLMAHMDKGGWCSALLFREHCTFLNGTFTKDLSIIGRNMKDSIIVDNSPAAYMLCPENAIPSISWYDDMNCRELYDFIPLLIDLSKVYDVREAITRFVKNCQINYQLASKVIGQLRQQEQMSQTPQPYQKQEEEEESEESPEVFQQKSSPMIGQQHKIQMMQDQKSATPSNFRTLQPEFQKQPHPTAEFKKPLINSWLNQQEPLKQNS